VFPSASAGYEVFGVGVRVMMPPVSAFGKAAGGTCLRPDRSWRKDIGLMEPATADVIATAVAPIVMVSAAGLLFIGIQTKNLHLADRIRDLTREYRAAGGPESTTRREAIRAQVALFETRLRMSQRALESIYIAIFCFVATAMLLAATPWFGRTPLIAGAVFTVGIAFVLVAIVLEFLEMRAGLETIVIELRSLK